MIVYKQYWKSVVFKFVMTCPAGIFKVDGIVNNVKCA